ncbi:MAG: EAL domain-containing protein [Stenomitos rutilans HA7619-LM2]|jgi:diguanylate cyclase (GGDEF)-like protein|nr:EAL domain-containing protein [Stenomitos rutilans HA7619-LM2]
MAQILVIEDDPLVSALILKLLKAEAFEVLFADDGLTGVKLAQAYEPDLIICDIMMPEFDGYEVLQQLRHEPVTAMIPFIFLSAKADRTDLRQGMELGADDYLTKPFKRAELLGAIAARLNKQAALTKPYIDEMKRAASTLGQIAYVDPLTSLPNRISFHTECQKAIEHAQQSNRLVAIVQFNLKDFRAINTTLGYFSGDHVLQKVAARLKQAAANYTVARLAGSDFGILLNALPSESAIADAAKRLLAALTEPYQLDGQSIQVQMRAGIAFYPDHGNAPGELLTCADLAVQSVSQNDQYQVYTPVMATIAAESRFMESQFTLALDQHELEIYYQPQVNLITGRIIGAEAILMWNHPERGLMHPSVLMPVAEEAVVDPIEQWMLETVCTQAKELQTVAQRPIRLAVNLSARQFQLSQERLVSTVSAVLQQTALDPEVLMLELTEAYAMKEVDMTSEKFQAFKAIGLHLALDEFGSGYSSLGHLKRFPLDGLKIDSSFIQKMLTDSDAAAIAKLMIAIGQSLQLKVIATGVDTIEQFKFLRQSGCYAMQGTLFSPPISTSELQELLRTDARFDSSTIAKDDVVE